MEIDRSNLAYKTAIIQAAIAQVSEPWHPISEPPNPEDFKPTGQVLCVTIFESGKIHPWFGTPKNQLADADYWMRIRPDY